MVTAKRANQDIREAISAKKIRVWQLADLLGISENTLIRKLRYELSDEEKKRVFEVIQKAEVE